MPTLIAIAFLQNFPGTNRVLIRPGSGSPGFQRPKAKPFPRFKKRGGFQHLEYSSGPMRKTAYFLENQGLKVALS
jgi:hypothetical protein